MIRLIDYWTKDKNGNLEFHYEPSTPKKFAEHLLGSAVEGFIENVDLQGDYEELTDREAELIHDQLQKIGARLYKTLHQ